MNQENDRLFEYFAIDLCVKCYKNKVYLSKIIDFMKIFMFAS